MFSDKVYRIAYALMEQDKGVTIDSKLEELDIETDITNEKLEAFKSVYKLENIRYDSIKKLTNEEFNYMTIIGWIRPGDIVYITDQDKFEFIKK